MTRPQRRSPAILVLVASLLAVQCTSCVFARIFYFNVPTLAAPGYFDERPVRASSHPLPFARRPEEAAFSARRSRTRSYPTFDDLLARNGTRAFVVLHHDVIVYERYFGEVTAETLLPCFSMSKTFAAVLVGCAQADGLLGSMDAAPRRLPPGAGGAASLSARSPSSTSCG